MDGSSELAMALSFAGVMTSQPRISTLLAFSSKQSCMYKAYVM